MVKIEKLNVSGYELSIMIINLKNESIISIPTQIGCPINCDFCISSESDFIRNLTSYEMIDACKLGVNHSKSSNIKLSFTGEGEPFLNIKAINEVIKVLTKDKIVTSFRICSSGIKPYLFSQIESSLPLELQFSLHSPIDHLRKKLIPISKPIKDILLAINQSSHNFQFISINYVLMDGINDSEEDLLELSKIINKDWLIKLNPLLDDEKYNFSRHHDYFKKYLMKNGHKVVIFNKIGSSIKNKVYDQLTYKKNSDMISKSI